MESTSTPGRPPFPFDLSPKRCHGPTAPGMVPDDFLAEVGPGRKFTAVDLIVMRHFCRKAFADDSVGNWETEQKLADDLGISLRSVQGAVHRIDRAGWIVRRVEMIDGRPVLVRVLRWLLPDDLHRYMIQFPQGHAFDPVEERVVPPASHARESPPQIPAEPQIPAIKIVRFEAQKSAPNKRDNPIQSASASAAFAPGEIEEARIEVTPPAPPPGPAVPIDGPPAIPPTPEPTPIPARKVATPEVCRAALADPSIAKFGVLAAPFLYDLIDQGEPLPAAWQGKKLPNRPVEAPPEPTRTRPQTPTPPKEPTTEDRIAALPRLVGRDANEAEVRAMPAIEAEVQALTTLIVAKLRDPDYRNWHAQELRRIACGWRKFGPYLTAFAVAKKATNEVPGKIFMTEYGRLVPRGHEPWRMKKPGESVSGKPPRPVSEESLHRTVKL